MPVPSSSSTTLSAAASEALSQQGQAEIHLPSKANGYLATPLPLVNLPPPLLRPAQKLPKKQQALALLARLKLIYPEAPCSLDYESPLQLMVATMLAAQCTDARVNLVTPALFARFPDAAAFANADREDLEALIRSTGFYRNKAKNIQAACRKIVTDFGGEVPKTMAALTSLPGIARKTANVVLAHGFGLHEGVTVDTHVKRISGLLGLTKQTDPAKVEQDLMKLLPRPDWENWSIRLVYHGRAVCSARSPQCARCDLLDLCPGAAQLRKQAAKAAKQKALKAQESPSKAKSLKAKASKTKASKASSKTPANT